jgi:iron transport multicopper oxidase
MHGHKFAVIGRSDSADGEESFDGEVKSALQRDTIQVPGNSKASIRFVADNPGAWMFHCHLEVRRLSLFFVSQYS